MEEPQVDSSSEKTINKKWWIIIVVALFAAAAVGGAVAGRITSQASLQFMTIPIPKPNDKNTLKGEVVASEMETFYHELSKGKIQTVFVKEGQTVKKGDKLFEYENKQIEALLKQNTIEQQLAQSRIEKAQKAIDLIREEIDDLESEEMVGSEGEVAALNREIAAQESDKQIAALQLEKAKIEEESLKSQQQDLVVYSNLEGVVGYIHPNPAASFAATEQNEGDRSGNENQQPIMTIFSNGPYHIQGTLTELQKDMIEPNLPVNVKTKAVPGQTWKGHIIAVSDYPQIDHSNEELLEQERTKTKSISSYLFKVQLDSSQRLFPGYHVTIKVELPSEMEILIPRSSVVKKGDFMYVYIVRNGKLKQQEISASVDSEKSYKVTEGLKHGDTILTNPSNEVKAGMKVDVE